MLCFREKLLLESIILDDNAFRLVVRMEWPKPVVNLFEHFLGAYIERGLMLVSIEHVPLEECQLSLARYSLPGQVSAFKGIFGCQGRLFGVVGSFVG